MQQYSRHSNLNNATLLSKNQVQSAIVQPP